jgi:hypothetical protein
MSDIENNVDCDENEYRYGFYIDHEGDPPEIHYHQDESTKREYYHSSDKLHREDSPSIVYYENGNRIVSIATRMVNKIIRLTRYALNKLIGFD